MRAFVRIALSGAIVALLPSVAAAAFIDYTTDSYTATVSTSQGGTVTRSGSLVETGGFQLTSGAPGPDSGYAVLQVGRPPSVRVAPGATSGPNATATANFEWVFEFSVRGSDAVWRASVSGRPNVGAFASLVDLSGGPGGGSGPGNPNPETIVPLIDGHSYRLKTGVGAFDYFGTAYGASGAEILFENATFVAVPEPATLPLAALSLGALSLALRRPARDLRATARRV